MNEKNGASVPGTHPASSLKNVPADILQVFAAAGQGHLFRFWKELEEKEREAFARELRGVDLAEVAKLAAGHVEKGERIVRDRAPAPVLRLGEEPSFATRRQAAEEGRKLLAAGKIGLFLVAGGQGSRLGCDGPKGCLPVGPLSGKTLFQLHAEKIAALGAAHGVRLPWYIMTSQANDDATRRFFKEHRFFGLRADDVFFLPQSMLPALDDAGKLILESKGSLFLSPNGHGGAYAAFRDRGGLDDAARRGIEHLFYFQVDNVLIRIADAEFLGLHALASSEMSLKVLRKTGPEEKLGVVVIEGGLTKVVEYSDLSKEEAKRRDAGGELAYWAGSIAIHAFSLSFFRRVSEGSMRLPYHLARKKIATIDATGKTVGVEGNKFETFVFDSLPFARASLSVEVRREAEFAPIKNRTGVDSLDSARSMILAEHRRWLQEAGVDAARRVEVSPLAALDGKELRERLERSAQRSFAGDVRVERDPDGKVRAHAVT